MKSRIAVPPPLSLDLRTRIVQACQEQDETQPEIAERFCVHVKTVEKLWRQWRETGVLAPKPHAGGAPALLAGRDEQVRALVAAHPDATLEELARLLDQRHGVAASVPVVWRCVRRLGLPRKKSR